VRLARAHRQGVRAVGIALALLTGAAPLLASLHNTVVRHIACPEDGELIDAPAGPPHHHGRVGLEAASVFSEDEPSAPHAAGADHGHCTIALLGHVRAVEHSSGQRASISFARSESPSIPNEPQSHGLATYRVAPKASPPAA